MVQERLSYDISHNVESKVMFNPSYRLKQIFFIVANFIIILEYAVLVIFLMKINEVSEYLN